MRKRIFGKLTRTQKSERIASIWWENPHLINRFTKKIAESPHLESMHDAACKIKFKQLGLEELKGHLFADIKKAMGS